MHLKYSKIFDIGDSAFMALKNCDAFAGEIYCDSIFYYSLSNSSNLENEYNINYDSLFTKDEIEQINKSLFKNTSSNLDDFKNQHISYLFEALYDNENLGYKKETILDAYLFYKAKCLGKKLLSVEYFNEYADIMDLLEIKTNKIREKVLSLVNDSISNDLINYYMNQDIEGINNYFDKSVDSLFNYKLIIERNNKMLRRIDEMVQKYSIFFAIGSGHLGGKNGLIKLLKEKGYKVEPVLKKISKYSKNFNTSSKNLKWMDYKFSDFGYQVTLPDKPLPVNISTYDVNISNMIYIDLGSGISYNTSSFPFDEKNIDRVLLTFDLVINKMKLSFGECKEVSRKTIKTDSIIGYEIEVYSFDKSIKIHVYKKNEFAYMFITKTNILNKDNYDIERFFKSVKYIEFDVNTWQKFYSENKSFSIDFPGTPEYYMIPSSSNIIKNIEMYSKQNSKEKKDYNLYVYNLKDGNIIIDNEKIKDVLLSIMVDLNPDCKYDSLEINVNGIKAIEYKVKTLKEQKAFKIIGINAVNKLYVIFAGNKTDSSVTDIDKFLNSFQIDFKINNELINHDIGGCTFLLPAGPVQDTIIDYKINSNSDKLVENMEIHVYVDTTAGFLWTYSIQTFNEFYRDKSDSSYLFKHLEFLRSYNDTILYSKYTVSDNVHILEYKLKENKLNDYERVGKIILSGRKFFHLSASAIPLIIQINPIDKILMSFKYNGQKDNWRISDDKTVELLAALMSDDTLRKNQAKQIIDISKFQEKDIDTIFKILLINHHDDNQNYSIKSELISSLDSLNFNRIFDFIKVNYDSIATSPNIQLSVCRLFSEIGTKESIKFTLNKIRNAKSKEIYDYQYYSIFHNLSKTGSLLNEFIPDFFELMKDTLFSIQIVDLLSNALDSNIIATDIIKKYEKQILELAKLEYQKSFIVDTNNDNGYRPVYNVISIVDLLIKIADLKETEDLYSNLMTDKDAYLRMKGIVGLFKFNEQIDNKIINKTAGDVHLRAKFYKDLNKINKLNYFPEEFKTQKAIAQSEFLNYLIDDDNEVDTVIYVDEIIREIKGKREIYFVYKFIVNNEDASYVGWRGPYPIKENKNELITESEYIYTNYEKYDRKNIERNFDEWIKEIEERSKQNGKN
jgi:uncharacterized protein YbaP (TraB family)